MREAEMKIAIEISGQLRSYKKTYKIFKEKFMNKDTDIFIHTWNNKGISTKDRKYVENTCCLVYSDKPDEEVKHSDIESLYNPIDFQIENFDKNMGFELNGIRLPKYLYRNEELDSDQLSNLPLFYGMWKASKLRRAYKKDYDLVIRTRADLNFSLININFETLDKSKVYVFPHLTNDKVSDKFAIGCPSLMNIYTEVFLNLQEYWYGNIKLRERLRHYECLLKYHLEQHNIQVKLI
jgi:hypothetical protein